MSIEFEGLKVERPILVDETPRRFNSDAMADAIRKMGFRYIPLTPGSSFRAVHDSIVNYLGNSSPQLILCLDEVVAVSVAHGYSKATAAPCPVLLHDLVGLMNGSMAVYNAYCDNVPLVILGGGGPSDRGMGRRPIDATHSAETQAELIRDFVKWTDEPTSIYGTMAGIYRATQLATSAPMGPTYVTLDIALQEQELPARLQEPDLADFAVAPNLAPDPELVVEALKLIDGARLPVVVAGGHLARNAAATPLLVRFLEVTGAAYLDADGSAVPTSHPLNAATDRRIVDDADVLLLIDVTDGSGVLGHSAGAMGGKTGSRKLIDLSFGDLGLASWSNVHSNIYRKDVQLLADPLKGLQALVSMASEYITAADVAARRQPIEARLHSSRASLSERVREHWDDRPISPERFTSELWSAVREYDWVLASSGGRAWRDGIWEFSRGGQLLGGSGGGGLGYGPGAVVGAALAAGDRGQFAVGVLGDGDFVMGNTALWTAAHYGLPALFVINDNHSFGNDEEHQRHVAGNRSRPLTNSGIAVHIDDPSVDFSQMARSMGCVGIGPVEDPGQLRDAFDEAVQAVLTGSTVLVHVITSLPGLPGS
jgi:thiamine pyrophosphate-dependent acetolactate synthase large subunit-like protein